MEFKIFQKYSKLKYGLSEKTDGSMKVNPETEGSIANRKKYFDKLGFKNVVAAGISHSCETQVVKSRDAGKIVYGVDGLATADKYLLLTITVADCFPVFFYDSKTGTIGIVHAGWRGIAAGVIPQAFTQMTKGLGCKRDDLLCGIGPGIEQQHFEVKEDVAGLLSNYQKHIQRGTNILVDLSGIIKDQLLDFGVPDANIELSGECTYCLKDKYFSYRRDHPENIEAMVAYIGLIAA